MIQHGFMESPELKGLSHLSLNLLTQTVMRHPSHEVSAQLC
jgi:hypothetical protein